MLKEFVDVLNECICFMIIMETWKLVKLNSKQVKFSLSKKVINPSAIFCLHHVSTA